MTDDYKKELRGILLVSLFITVVPLVFFPKDFGLGSFSSFALPFALALGWYLLVFFITFSKAPAPKVFLLALLTFGYRIGLGIGFALLLLVMFSLPLSSALRLGTYQYLPVVLLQTLMSPFVLKSVFQALVQEKEKGQGAEEADMRKSMFIGEVAEPPDSDVPAGPKGKLDRRKPLSFEKETGVPGENKLDNIVHYLREYAGVKAAILVDHEGLVVAEDSSDFDPETVASFALCFKEANDQVLRDMGERNSQRIGIYTEDLWMCLHQIGDLTLVVLSDRRTDDLLSVRISQSTGMIRKFLAEKYEPNVLKVVEV